MTSDSNKDIIAQAQSGTGKTGAFTISILQKLSKIDYSNHVEFCIDIGTTHELAMQSMKVLSSISRFMFQN